MNNCEIQRINDRFLFSIPQKKTDIAILLGSTMCGGDIARHAANLYHRGYFSEIVLCGGSRLKPFNSLHRKVNNTFARAAKHSNTRLSIPLRDIFSLQSEANHMAKTLSRSGVPRQAIIHRDTHSQNTGQNFEFIQGTIDNPNIQSATIVCAVFHQRRALETCKKWFPNLHAITAPITPYGISKDDWTNKWPQIEFARIAMLGEDYRLNPDRNPEGNYYIKGFCTPVDVDSLSNNQPQRRLTRGCTL